MKSSVSIFDRVEQMRVESSQAVTRLAALKTGLRLALKVELARALESVENIFKQWELLFEEVYQQSMRKNDELTRISKQLQAAEHVCCAPTSPFRLGTVTRRTVETQRGSQTGETLRLKEPICQT